MAQIRAIPLLYYARTGQQNTLSTHTYQIISRTTRIIVTTQESAASPTSTRKIPSALQGSVAPILDVNVGFLVQLADGGGRDLAAPQCLRDVLHPAHGNACQVHLDERLLHAALPAAIPLDDGRLEGHALEPRHMERDIAGGRGEAAVIVAAAVALTGLAALIAGGLCQRLRLLAMCKKRPFRCLSKVDYLYPIPHLGHSILHSHH